MRVNVPDNGRVRARGPRGAGALRDLDGLPPREVEAMVNASLARVLRRNPRLVAAMNAATLDRSRPAAPQEVRAVVGRRLRIAARVRNLVVRDLRHNGVDARGGDKETQIRIGRRAVEVPKNVEDPFAIVDWIVGLIVSLVRETSLLRTQHFLDGHREQMRRAVPGQTPVDMKARSDGA